MYLQSIDSKVCLFSALYFLTYWIHPLGTGAYKGIAQGISGENKVSHVPQEGIKVMNGNKLSFCFGERKVLG